MTAVVLRLSGPLQSWSGYRHLVNMQAVVPSEAVPRKSAINGLIGAALGPIDHGHGSARLLDEVGRRYALHVRVDRRNATTEDFQVLGALPAGAAKVADRSHRLAALDTGKGGFPNERRGRGNFPTTVSRRDFLSHTEFVAAIETDDDTARAWIAALREPMFMPYLGRRSCAPTFPFVLGVHEGPVSDLFAALPRVDVYQDPRPLVGYEVTGDYDRHDAREHPSHYTPTATTERRDQLRWAQENLR